jgi:hypothetical protein
MYIPFPGANRSYFLLPTINPFVIHAPCQLASVYSTILAMSSSYVAETLVTCVLHVADVLRSVQRDT